MSDTASQANYPADSIYACLATLCGTHRFLTLSFDDPVLPPAAGADDGRLAPAPRSADMSGILSSIFAVEAFVAVDGLHEIGACDVLLLCADAHLPLKQLVSRHATLRINGTDGSSAHESVFSGLISQAERLGSEAGLARYRVRLVPWLWLLSQSSGCRVWQDTTVTDIVDDLFRQYQPHAAWRWTPEAKSFLHGARTRSYTVQYRETDLAFVSRVLAEEGITWRIEEGGTGNAEAGQVPAASGHVLVLLADTTDAASAPENPTSRTHHFDSVGSVPNAGLSWNVCRDAARLDCIQSVTSTTTLRSAVTTVLAPGALGARSIAASATAAPAWRDTVHAERQARLLQQAVDATTRRVEGRSTVRSLRAGHQIILKNNTEATGRSGQPALFGPDAFPGGAITVLRSVSVGINNLPGRQGIRLTASWVH